MDIAAIIIVATVALVWIRSRIVLGALLLTTGLALVVFRARLTTHVFMMVDENTRVPMVDHASQTTSLCVGLVLSFLGAGLFLIETYRGDHNNKSEQPIRRVSGVKNSRETYSSYPSEVPSFKELESTGT
jgi:hypothetical protein